MPAQEDAAARNAQRAEADQVPQEVLSRMAARLEPPCPSKHAWESSTVIVPTEELPSPDDPHDQACQVPRRLPSCHCYSKCTVLLEQIG